MIKKFTIYSVFLLFGLCAANGQNYYGLYTGIQAYVPLTNATAVTLNDSQGKGRYFSYDLLFNTYGVDADFKANGSSLGAFMAFDGYLEVNSGTAAQGHTVVYQLMLLRGIDDGLRLKNNSVMQYKYDGTPGSGILKIEWVNMGLKKHHDSEYVNLQLWFDETDQSITYYYGAQKTSGAFETHTGLFTTPNTQFGFFDNAMNFFGIPQRFVVLKAGGYSDMPTFTSLPEDGRYFKFTPNNTNTTGIVKPTDGNDNNRFYPNPATQSITIEQPTAYTIMDMTGKLVAAGETQTYSQSITIDVLRAGVYCINFTQNNTLTSGKLIITE